MNTLWTVHHWTQTYQSLLMAIIQSPSDIKMSVFRENLCREHANSTHKDCQSSQNSKHRSCCSVHQSIMLKSCTTHKNKNLGGGCLPLQQQTIQMLQSRALQVKIYTKKHLITNKLGWGWCMEKIIQQSCSLANNKRQWRYRAPRHMARRPLKYHWLPFFFPLE